MDTKVLKEESPVTTALDEDEQRNLTVEDIVDLGDACLGLRILLVSREGTYMGVINLVLPSSRRLSLEKVCNPKTGKKRVGLLTFFFHNILKITVIGEDREAKERLLKDVYQEDQRGKQLLMKKIVPPHLIGYDTNQLDEDVLLGRVENNPASSSDGRESADKEKQPPPPPPARIPRPAKWLVVDNLEDAYVKALEFIKNENTISISMEGQNLGRGGSLAWFSVATTSIIFLFDMAKIGAGEALEKGLGDVLKDNAVLKVVHDCRAMEDMLHHQFGINLNNVFDTQAAEVYVHMLQHRGAVPSFVSGLPTLLIRYLKLSPSHVFFSHVRQECSENDELVWFERPLPSHLGEGLARNVMYLRELRLELLDLILVDLTQVTNLYLGSLRDKDSVTISNLELHVVPAEVQKLGKRTVSNSVINHDPYVHYSRDAFKIVPQKKY
ncbi:piRNA biogenesis protein EXD1-like isoform X1 [Penaeus japonicus]|uniref:piRNA biogenesis protein EXD1-like isoform X1 n=1 Tax=Penaeus japonicus TaxID=27405 RepID=UPI001C716641|nr:piRNA biogenesis protein EXD1-like isoform X1 [Penaeus japonicus]